MCCQISDHRFYCLEFLKFRYQTLIMASPAVAGAISLLLAQKPYLSPDEVKLALKRSCVDLGLEPNRQGFGKLDIDALLRV